jgi:cytochrome c oxidase subunit 2
MSSGLLFFAVVFAGALLFAIRPAWFPLSIDSAAHAWDRQFAATLIVTGIIFIGAHVLLGCTILRARRKKFAGSANSSLRLEIFWTSAAAVLFLSLAALGSRGWARVPERAPGEERIEVYARQFAWHFRYPGPDGVFGRTANKFISDSGGNPIGLDPADVDGRDDIVSATLRVPVGRNVLLLLHSRDVIHDFFVRELRTKQDIVPGMEIPLEIRVDRPGQYEIACAELCGLGHSQMHSLLIAMPPAEYVQWKHAH